MALKRRNIGTISGDQLRYRESVKKTDGIYVASGIIDSPCSINGNFVQMLYMPADKNKSVDDATPSEIVEYVLDVIPEDKKD